MAGELDKKAIEMSFSHAEQHRGVNISILIAVKGTLHCYLFMLKCNVIINILKQLKTNT